MLVSFQSQNGVILSILKYIKMQNIYFAGNLIGNVLTANQLENCPQLSIEVPPTAFQTDTVRPSP